MIFVPIKGDAALLAPAGIGIFLSFLVVLVGLFPFFGGAPCFDLLILFRGIALARRLDKGRINDAACTADESGLFQPFLKEVKEGGR